MKKDLVTIADLRAEEIAEIFALTDELKKNKNKFSSSLKGKTLALLFQKPSNRTRVSFEVGMYQLGGYSIYISAGEINLGVREAVKDVAKTLSRYVNGIVLRTFAHHNVLELAKHASVPVINGLSDYSHPCQALSDIYTVKEKLGVLKGKTLAYIGDGNNVCNSLLFAAAKTGLNMNVATPQGYEPEESVLKDAISLAKKSKAMIKLFGTAEEAAKGADVIYTDVWASMGKEKERGIRLKAFKAYQVNGKLVKGAKEDYIFMHCLPAHRGEEVTDEVADSENSVIFDQAENRLHTQKALLALIL